MATYWRRKTNFVRSFTSFLSLTAALCVRRSTLPLLRHAWVRRRRLSPVSCVNRSSDDLGGDFGDELILCFVGSLEYGACA